MTFPSRTPFLFALVLFFACPLLAAQDMDEAVRDGDLETVRALLGEHPDLIELRDSDRMTPLLLASREGRAEIVQLLLERGADVNAADGRGMTPLHVAAERGHDDVARMLLDSGADVDGREVNGRTPLFFAARGGHIDLCRLLLDKGASIDAANNFGRTPVLYAVWRDHTSIVKFFCEKGADLNVLDEDGHSPLHHVCIDGQLHLARLLLDKGADPGLKDKAGRLPLHLAANNGHDRIVTLLLGRDVDIDLKDSGGDTPLFGAVWHGNVETVSALVQKGARVDVKNDVGMTPMDYAELADHTQVVDLLASKGAPSRGSTKAEKEPDGPSPPPGTNEAATIKMTVVYDNYACSPGARTEWGFACLIEGTEKTILFDTGGNGEALAENAKRLNLDWKKVDLIVISHKHWDHVGGLETVLEERPNIPVYLLNAFPYDLVRRVEAAGGNVVSVKGPLEVCPNVLLTGEMGDSIKEQSLIVNTSLGSVVVTGCSHQGIVNILEKTKQLVAKDIYLVFGGFHLMGKSDDETREIIRAFKDLRVRKCGATHCTGDRQIALFKEAYGDDYVPMGIGRIIHLSTGGMRIETSR